MRGAAASPPAVDADRRDVVLMDDLRYDGLTRDEIGMAI